VYGEGSTEVIEGMHTELKRKPFGTDDIRFTFRHGILYAFVLKWPEDGQISIKSLGRESRVYKGQVQELSLLSGNADLNWKQTDDALRIDASRAGKFDMPACFRISLS
jgi:alpha-L-fucosidase